MPILALIGYHFLFFQKFYRNPFLLSTSEIASTYFPFWISMGRKWKPKDDIYYGYPACIPFLSMWYWPNVLFSYISKFLCIDNAFTLYTWLILGHYLLASIIAYKVLGLFGAITLTYAAYCIKPQTPSFVYTMCWMPGMLIKGWFGAFFCCFMAITGGYWPILVYFLPIAGIINPLCMLGSIPALCQIIPFVWYWPKSIRSGEKADKNFGRLPWWKLMDLFIPAKNTAPTNDAHYPEVEMYMGIAILFIWQVSWWWILFGLCVLIICGILPSIQRIPCRAIYLLTFLLAAMSKTNLIPNYIVLLQMYFLLRNSSIYPSFPFSQWWKRPSELYHKAKLDGTWPNVTGYLSNIRISSYKGAFRMKEPLWTI